MEDEQFHRVELDEVHPNHDIKQGKALPDENCREAKIRYCFLDAGMDKVKIDELLRTYMASPSPSLQQLRKSKGHGI